MDTMRISGAAHEAAALVSNCTMRAALVLQREINIATGCLVSLPDVLEMMAKAEKQSRMVNTEPSPVVTFQNRVASYRHTVERAQ